LSGVPYEPVVVISFLALLFMMVALRKIPWNFRRVAGLGVLTYPLYLIYDTIVETLLMYYITPSNKYLLFVLVTAPMLGVAYLIHRFIECLLAPKLKGSLLNNKLRSAKSTI